MALTLKQRRLLADRSQEECAKALGVHRETYRKFENDVCSMSISQAIKLAKYLNYEWSSIFFKEICGERAQKK